MMQEISNLSEVYPNIPSSNKSGIHFSIGGVIISPPVVLAPMADVTNGAFRRICARIGRPGLFCTEQISTMALHYASDRTRKMLDWTEVEHPLSVQLFGADPGVMAEAARIMEGLGADIVDINMGCWVPKVCRQGAGAALLKDEETALNVVSAVVKAVEIPVTVKMRAGWDVYNLSSVSLAVRFEEIGAQAFTLHARTARQGFDGEANWQLIKNIREAVKVPVIGNGDIRTPQDALRMMQETGCNGVMVGRAAIGNPWILRDIRMYLTTGNIPAPPDLSDRISTAMEHLEGLSVAYGEDKAVRHLRAQLPRYITGYPGAVKARLLMNTASTLSEVRAIMDDLLTEV
jgi:nifR3 family TIM-barrel protein